MFGVSCSCHKAIGIVCAATHLVRASLDEGDGREVFLLRWFTVHCDSGGCWDGGWRKEVERRGGRRAVGLGRVVRWGLFVVVLDVIRGGIVVASVETAKDNE